MEVPNGSTIKKMVGLDHSYSRKWLVGLTVGPLIWWIKALPSIGSGWLVSWLVNLVKWANITISELLWLKFGMDITKGT